MSLPVVEKVQSQLGKIGLIGERKAISLLILALFSGYFLILTLVAKDQLPEWYPAFAAMLAMYGITFFSVAANWFFGRWIAVGIGSWGATMAVWGMISQRELNPVLLFLGGTHALVAILLSGESMAADYEGRTGWRTRLGLDDAGVTRLGKSVTRAASSLPAIVLFALAPRQEDGSALLVVALVGVGALLMGRTLSIAALAAAAVGAFALSTFTTHGVVDTNGLFYMPSEAPHMMGLYAGVALTAAVSPFVAPIGRFLRSSR
jgi:hypothetical protein